MNKTFALVVMAVMGLSSAAFAGDTAIQAVKSHNDFDFVINGHTDMGNEVYYNCQSVEDFTESFLTKLGATNINVHCTGGIDWGIPSLYPSVTVSFDSIRVPSATVTGAQVAAAWTDVKLHGWDNCHLANQVLAGVKDHFDIQGLKTSGHCSDSNDSYHIELSTLMAK